MTATTTKYIEAVGRRKTATARVRITPASKMSYSVNGVDIDKYFPTRELRLNATDAISSSKIGDKFDITIIVKGGGKSAQSEAVRHGISRALIVHDSELRTRLKKLGYLKRDPRAKERRKFGLKKARKAPQWSKR